MMDWLKDHPIDFQGQSFTVQLSMCACGKHTQGTLVGPTGDAPLVYESVQEVLDLMLWTAVQCINRRQHVADAWDLLYYISMWRMRAVCKGQV